MLYNKKYKFLYFVISLILCSSCATANRDSSQSILCIAPLNNNTDNKQYDAFAEGFADILITAMNEKKSVKVVERKKLKNLLKEQKLSLNGLAKPDTAVKIGKLLNADRIIVGGISKPKDNFVINVHAYETQTARLIASEQIETQPQEIMPASIQLANKLCAKINIELSPVDPNNIDKNPNSSLHFIRGLGYFYVGHYDNAIIEFMKTQDLDSDSDKAGYWMALCFMENKEYKHALIELEALILDFPESDLMQDIHEKIKLCTKYIEEKKHQK